MKSIKAPNDYRITGTSIFLAGSIEMGLAQEWQSVVTEALQDTDITILNPRRDAWDSSWKQEIGNEKFKEQVDWELNGMEVASKIFMYFDPATKSPISLLELGLHADENKLIVCCPDGFWRKGNVEIVCERYSIPLFSTLGEAIEHVRSLIEVYNTFREIK